MSGPYHRICIDPELAGILTLESVPPVTTTRWNARRKAQVVRAVEVGLLTEAEACRLYDMTIEELAAWQRAMDAAGVRGLRATKRVKPKWVDRFGSAWDSPRPARFGEERQLEHVS